ncbi:MAG TPA: MG2 domain-containing protein [Pyrinomonadaceae bacterium]|nr:MG2 domain-containing protein [Pyrinomonadaceae bacterium]
MNRRWLSLLLCLQVCLCALAVGSSLATATAGLRVNEASTRIALAEGQSKVLLAVENDTGRPTAAHVTLELLDPRDKIAVQTEHDETIKPGASVVALFLPVSTYMRDGTDRRQLLWYRLRYRVAPVQSTDLAPVEGVVSLSEITPDLFELHVAAASKANAGEPYRVRVRATHPLTSRPVRGVEVVTEISIEEGDDDRKLKQSGTTGGDGYATFDFTLPQRITDDEADLSVTARRGDVIQTAYDDISFEQATRVLLTSDKPLYQPGQVLHMRALMLKHATRRAIADASAMLKIEDPEGTTVFNAPLKTSRFGVASVDWPIPDNTRLGDYTITVTPEGGDSDGESNATQKVKISRYDLPNFSVAAKPDRGYYLPGEGAQVEVRGDYLFGQPLKRGHVRVVRETERTWNYREQKYDIEEAEKYEGELGSDGRFTARIDLAKEHAELTQHSWARFEDLTYAAYVTDPTTNRTEQRRFRLRLTREPIHVYVVQGNYQQAEGLPLAFFVSTSYADGTPAACEVQVSLRGEADKVLRTIKTNAYGVAKMYGPRLERGEARESRDLSLVFAARDREGRTARYVEQIWLPETPVVRVETGKTIYRAGEPITAEFSSSKPDLKLFVDVVSDRRVVETHTVRLQGGRATLEIPYRPELQNRVTLAAYTTDIPDHSYGEFTKATRTVIYPRNRELKFDLRMSQAVYQPGEEASADVRVRTADGRNAESALGVVVFDKAVEERARTEQEFSSSYGFSDYFYYFWYGSESIGGVNLRDVEQLNPARTLPDGLDTVAELLLQRDDYENYRPNFFGGSNYDTNQMSVFAKLAEQQLKGVKVALDTRYAQRMEYPSNEAELRRTLALADISLADLRDPWGTPYRPAFSVERNTDVLHFMSAGADKKHGTDDDWAASAFTWLYFRPAGEAINRAFADYHKRTGGFIRDASTLKAELARADFNPDLLRDRWGKPYEFRFGISGKYYTLNILTGGANGVTETPENYPYSTNDDFFIWTTMSDYFTDTRALIDTALNAYLRTSDRFPQDEATLRDVLRRVKIDLANLKDPWQHAYYVTFRAESRYTDRVEYNGGGQTPRHTPVTRQLEFVTIRSAGADGQQGTYDDFNVAQFSHIVSDQSARDKQPKIVPAVTTFSGETGAISGTVVDPNGAAVAGATVSATNQQQTDRVFETLTGEEGDFLLRNLPAGLYTLRVEAQGFVPAVVMDVQVQSSTLATLNFNLSVGAVMETVNVTSTQVGMQSDAMYIITSESASSLKSKPGLPPAQKAPISTPRLRKDFPETLYWQPAVETDRDGRTKLQFKLADNITTWKMSIIGSTETGELGTVEREIRAFQPFFVEHDPPRVLTEGDEISLPVVLRNYLDRAQPVALDIKPEEWFTMIGPAHKQSNVPAGDATRETFDFRAVASVKEGLQRITAIGSDGSDQIEKPVRVHPDGEELADTTTQIMRATSTLRADVPTYAIPRSAHAELKIYPNLLAHAIESVEGIMARPNGCAEQTISSTYPSLLVLRHYKRAGDGAQLPPVASKAEQYIKIGYDRLLSYRSDSGGFSYWGRGDADLALTAYAVRFLSDAREFIKVDEDVLKGARRWLVGQQRADGSWAALGWDKKEDSRRTAMLTAYVARILAMSQSPEDAAADKNEALAKFNAEQQSQPQRAGLVKPEPPLPPLGRALAYLAPRVEETDEPYMLASYALAAIDGGDAPARFAQATAKLRDLARNEGDATYWSLETNTPFYGWGHAGRIETTALVVQALTKANDRMRNEDAKSNEESKSAASPSAIRNPKSETDELVNRGLLFLLKNKDRYGVWLSTQATVNVLDALDVLSHRRDADTNGDTVAAASRAGTTNAAGAQGEQAEVFVNGQSAGTVTLPASEKLVAPVTLDLTRFVAAGDNRVEVRRAPAASAVVAQVVTTYYVPWANSTADGTHAKPTDSRALRLAVNFDKPNAGVGDTVTCRVEAERIGHRGYGMLLAEVGLPPGADVDRASLERAMKESGWDFSHYDVLPDRLVVYLWPRAGGTNFQFTFRPRFGLAAKTASSVVYDYYNPEARATLAPTKFVVGETAKTTPAQAGRE